MRKFLFLILYIIFISLSSLLQAKRIIVFQEAWQHPIISDIDGNHFFIYELKSCNIWMCNRLSNEKYNLKKIGNGKGEGPFEFKWINHVKSFKGFIFVNSGDKISYFYRDGSPKEEKKTPYDASTYLPVGNNFVCKKYYSTVKQRTISIKALNSNLEVKKNLMETQFQNYYNSTNNKQNFVVIRDFFEYKVEKERIYVGNTQKGFHFSVFDADGNKQYEINRHYEKCLITSKHKQEELDELLRMVGKARYNRALKKYNLLYPEYFPAYSNFSVSDGKIYILTYPKINGKQEMLVLNGKGDLIKKVKEVPTGQYSEPFCVYRGKYYYLNDNAETEKWEIHEIEID